MDAFATAISFNLQYGVPLKFLVDKFAHVRFEPSGWTGNQQIPYAKSIMDYMFRWLGNKFLGSEYAVTEAGETMTLRATEPDPQQQLPFRPMTADAPLCSECGSIMTRNGSCYKCGNCGGTSGASAVMGLKGSCCCGSGSVARSVIVSPASVTAYSLPRNLLPSQRNI